VHRLPAILLVLGPMFLGIGALCSGRASDEWAAYQEASRPARALPLRELLDKGAGENGHVIITDFIVRDDYLSERGGRAVLFLLPPEHEKPKNKDQNEPLVLVLSKPYLFYEVRKAPVEETIRAISQDNRLEGIVSRWTPDRFGDSAVLERNHLIPWDVDLNKSLVVREIRPAGRDKALALAVLSATMIGVGCVAFLLGIVLGIREAQRRKRMREALLAAADRTRPNTTSSSPT
jgi:hypothetical protein